MSSLQNASSSLRRDITSTGRCTSPARSGSRRGGVAADLRPYAGQEYYDLREILARTKDFFLCLLKPGPTYLGDAIPVTGDGDLTNG